MKKIDEIIEQVESGKILPEEAYEQIIKIFNIYGCFNIDDIKEVYEIGRNHEKNKSTCTGEEIKLTWLRAYILNGKIKWK